MTAVTTPRLGVTMMTAGVMQPDVIFNEGMLTMDALMGGTFLDYTIAVPASPASGDTYIVGASATGAWTGKDQDIAFYYNGWQFLTAPQHLKMFNIADGKYYTKGSSVWTADAISAVTHLSDLTDVSAGSPTNGQALTWNATDSKWEPATAITDLADLADVTLTSLANGQFLKWNATDSKWENYTFPSLVTALAGLSDFDAAAEADGYVAYWKASTSKLSFKATTAFAVVASLSNVGDVTYTGLTTNDVLAWNGAAWAPSTSIPFKFSMMTDGPGTLVGQAGKYLQCNSLETALQWAAGAGGATALTGLTDVTVTEGSRHRRLHAELEQHGR